MSAEEGRLYAKPLSFIRGKKTVVSMPEGPHTFVTTVTAGMSLLGAHVSSISVTAVLEMENEEEKPSSLVPVPRMELPGLLQKHTLPDTHWSAKLPR